MHRLAIISILFLSFGINSALAVDAPPPYLQSEYYTQSGYYNQSIYYVQSSYYTQSSYTGGYTQSSYSYAQAQYVEPPYSQSSYGLPYTQSIYYMQASYIPPQYLESSYYNQAIYPPGYVQAQYVSLPYTQSSYGSLYAQALYSQTSQGANQSLFSKLFSQFNAIGTFFAEGLLRFRGDQGLTPDLNLQISQCPAGQCGIPPFCYVVQEQGDPCIIFPPYTQASYGPYFQSSYYSQAAYVPYAQATYYTQAGYPYTQAAYQPYTQATYYTQGGYLGLCQSGGSTGVDVLGNCYPLPTLPPPCTPPQHTWPLCIDPFPPLPPLPGLPPGWGEPCDPGYVGTFKPACVYNQSSYYSESAYESYYQGAYQSEY